MAHKSVNNLLFPADGHIRLYFFGLPSWGPLPRDARHRTASTIILSDRRRLLFLRRSFLAKLCYYLFITNNTFLGHFFNTDDKKYQLEMNVT